MASTYGLTTEPCPQTLMGLLGAGVAPDKEGTRGGGYTWPWAWPAQTHCLKVTDSDSGSLPMSS